MTFWTEADTAELDVLVWALTGDYAEHREHCETCIAGRLSCPSVQRAIAEVVEWREARILLSRAQALRAELEVAA